SRRYVANRWQRWPCSARAYSSSDPTTVGLFPDRIFISLDQKFHWSLFTGINFPATQRFTRSWLVRAHFTSLLRYSVFRPISRYSCFARATRPRPTVHHDDLYPGG